MLDCIVPLPLRRDAGAALLWRCASAARTQDEQWASYQYWYPSNVKLVAIIKHRILIRIVAALMLLITLGTCGTGAILTEILISIQLL
jgi:hypothetical protein